LNRIRAKSLLYIATLLLLIGHGGAGDCNDCRSLTSCRRSSPNCGLGSTASWTSTGTCHPGTVTIYVESDCGVLVRLPDDTLVRGSRSTAAITFESSAGICVFDSPSEQLRCTGDAGSCESTLSLQVDAGTGYDAGTDAGQDAGSDAGDVDSGP